MDEKTINIDKLIISNRKTISIEINQIGNLIVRAPNFVSKTKILSFVNSKSKWILEKQKILRAKINEKNEFLKNKIMFFGNEYKIIFNKNIDKLLILNNNELIINSDNKEISQKIIKYWLKKNAKHYFSKRIEELARKYHFSFNKFKFSNSIYKWGSCNNKKNISINWRLIMAEQKLSDYVLIHELAHTVHFNHSKKFWETVEKIIPDYKELKRQLKNISHLLDYN